MWLLTFFPSFLPHVILLLGLLLFLATFFIALYPPAAPYKAAAKVVALILIVFGIYLEGGLAYKNKIDKEVADLKVELAEAQVKGQRVSIQIVDHYITTTKVIREKGNTITKYIEVNKDRIDAACTIPQDVIDAHNAAASLDAKELEKLKIGKPVSILPPRTDNHE